MNNPSNRSFHLRLRAWLLAACAALAGCADGTRSQVVTGQLAQGAIAVRAVDGEDVVTAAQVRSNGAFTLALPSGGRYRLEVLTATGVKHVYARGQKGLRDLTFQVCKPEGPWDVGVVKPPGGGGGTCDPKKGPGCKCDPSGKCDGGGGSGGGGGTCDPKTDPGCKCDPSGKCDGGGGGGGSGGGGGTCDPKTDPGCKCDPGGKCDGGSCDPKLDPYCKPNCNDPTDKDCSSSPPSPCKDPKDPNTCKDECAYEPASCGCPGGAPNCWGDPCKPACDVDGNCSGDDALTPDRPPVDFGCQGLR